MYLQNITNLIRLISFTNDSEVSRFINNQNDFSKAYLGGGGGDEIMTNLIKSRSIPPMGALRPISDPLPYFAYTSFTGWLHPWLVWDCSSHSRIFHSFGNVTIAGEGLQIVTYARQLWPLSSEGSLTCHTYCDTSQPFIVVMSEDPGHSLFSVSQWGCL